MQKRFVAFLLVIVVLSSAVFAQTMTRSSAPKTQARDAECIGHNNVMLKIIADVKAKIDIVRVRIARLKEIDVEIQKLKVQIDILIELIQKITTDTWWSTSSSVTCESIKQRYPALFNSSSDVSAAKSGVPDGCQGTDVRGYKEYSDPAVKKVWDQYSAETAGVCFLPWPKQGVDCVHGVQISSPTAGMAGTLCWYGSGKPKEDDSLKCEDLLLKQVQNNTQSQSRMCRLFGCGGNQTQAVQWWHVQQTIINKLTIKIKILMEQVKVKIRVREALYAEILAIHAEINAHMEAWIKIDGQMKECFKKVCTQTTDCPKTAVQIPGQTTQPKTAVQIPGGTMTTPQIPSTQTTPTETSCSCPEGTSTTPPSGESILAQLNQYRCVSGASMKVPGTRQGNCPVCYGQVQITVNSQPPVCQTPCGPVACDSSASCPCPDKPNCTLTASCKWGGWKQAGQNQFVPVVG